LEAVLLLILGAENTHTALRPFSTARRAGGGEATPPARAFAGTRVCGYNAEASCI